MGNNNYDIPLAKDKRIFKLLSQIDAYKKDLPPDCKSGIQIVCKRRIFSSLYQLKNFKKLSKRPLELLYYQIKHDYIDKNILKDACGPEDVILFASLILKVILQSKILRSKDNKISRDLLLKNIH